MVTSLQPELDCPAARILVLEDCPRTCVVIEQALMQFAILPSTAATHERGVELAAREPFDLILLDLSSPSLRAIEFCKLLRENPFTRDVPVVFLADWKTDKAAAVEVKKLGAAAIITKPFQTLEFIERVISCLRHQPYQCGSIHDWVRNR